MTGLGLELKAVGDKPQLETARKGVPCGSHLKKNPLRFIGFCPVIFRQEHGPRRQRRKIPPEP